MRVLGDVKMSYGKNNGLWVIVRKGVGRKGREDLGLWVDEIEWGCGVIMVSVGLEEFRGGKGEEGLGLDVGVEGVMEVCEEMWFGGGKFGSEGGGLNLWGVRIRGKKGVEVVEVIEGCRFVVGEVLIEMGV